MDYSIYQHIEKRTVIIGFISFIVIVFAFPFITGIIASFGVSDNVFKIMVPLIQYKFVLIILAGLITGYISKNSPLINSIAVGILGYIAWLIIISISITLTETTFSINFIASQSLVTISLCAAGGLCVSLFKYVSAKL